MSKEVVKPEAYSRRGFVYRKLREHGARFAEVAGAAVAMTYGREPPEVEQARRLALADLSPLPRVGFKGPGVGEWLADQGMNAPAESNRATVQDNGSVVARLSPAELLVLDDLAGESGTVERLRTDWQNREKTSEGSWAFMAPREDSHAWFSLAGADVPAMLAKLCAVDLRPGNFTDGAIAQTSVARLSATVIRCDLGETLHYHLLADSAAAAYLWECLMDAMDEFHGKPVGLIAL